MQPKLIALVVLLVILLVFALQNTQPLAIKFLIWETTASAVLTILVSFCLGGVAGFLAHYLKPSRKF